ncbi:hypothetical protein LZ023_39945 (plasmid) [Pseudomonas silvicola]|nr:hypothetical protein LZ023_39945 [Pseudomonas silvicola]
MMYRISGQTALTSISVKLKDDVVSGPAVESLTQLLTARHGTKDFLMFNRDKYRKAIEGQQPPLTLLILMVASDCAG